MSAARLAVSAAHLAVRAEHGVVCALEAEALLQQLGVGTLRQQPEGKHLNKYNYPRHHQE